MELLLTGVLTFAVTNIDDIFLLLLFFGNPKLKAREIVTGQLAGIGALTALSLAASLVGLLIDKPYIGLLGLIPVYLGAKGLWTRHKENGNGEVAHPEVQRRRKSSHVLTVAGTTIANGGDNIGIYVPLFATLAWTGKLAMVVLFMVMTLLWCCLARYLTKHPFMARTIGKYGHRVTPYILILLGLYILFENGSLQLFTG